jgi:hypothetical protein
VDVVGRCVVATTGAVVVGRVVAGCAVAGGVVVVGATVVGAAVVAGAVLVEAARRAAGLAGGVGGPATNPTWPSRDTSARAAATGVTICSLRYQGRPGRGGGGAPHCDGARGGWSCGAPHSGGRPGCGGGVDPAAGGWAGGWLGCCGPQPCGFTHRSGTAAYLRREAGADVITGVSDSRIVTPQRRPRRFGRHIRGLVILLVIPPAVTPQVSTLLAGRAHRRDQQEPHSHARAGPRLRDS